MFDPAKKRPPLAGIVKFVNDFGQIDFIYKFMVFIFVLENHVCVCIAYVSFDVDQQIRQTLNVCSHEHFVIHLKWSC